MRHRSKKQEASELIIFLWACATHMPKGLMKGQVYTFLKLTFYCLYFLYQRSGEAYHRNYEREIMIIHRNYNNFISTMKTGLKTTLTNLPFFLNHRILKLKKL